MLTMKEVYKSFVCIYGILHLLMSQLAAIFILRILYRKGGVVSSPLAWVQHLFVLKSRNLVMFLWNFCYIACAFKLPLSASPMLSKTMVAGQAPQNLALVSYQNAEDQNRYRKVAHSMHFHCGLVTENKISECIRIQNNE